MDELYGQPAVSIHAPARGATADAKGREHGRHVSIHAPARGATADAKGREHGRHVSIHAPARGATFKQYAGTKRLTCFNPRPRAGGD